MKIYTYSQAALNLSELLALACQEEVIIQCNDGKSFSIVPKTLPQPSFQPSKSPFDVPAVEFKHSVTTQDILDAIEESRKIND